MKRSQPTWLTLTSDFLKWWFKGRYSGGVYNRSMNQKPAVFYTRCLSRYSFSDQIWNPIRACLLRGSNTLWEAKAWNNIHAFDCHYTAKTCLSNVPLFGVDVHASSSSAWLAAAAAAAGSVLASFCAAATALLVRALRISSMTRALSARTDTASPVIAVWYSLFKRRHYYIAEPASSLSMSTNSCTESHPTWPTSTQRPSIIGFTIVLEAWRS